MTPLFWFACAVVAVGALLAVRFFYSITIEHETEINPEELRAEIRNDNLSTIHSTRKRRL